MSMASKFPGKCKLCKVAFTAGTQIFKEVDHWCSIEACAKKSMTQTTPAKTVTPAPATNKEFIRDTTVKLYQINQQVQQTLKTLGETHPDGGMIGQFTRIIYDELNEKETKK